ncbi:TMEM165/GDT1 family protein [Alkalicella caledoniensis]|uniref:GDT1 family protein n=1 Tax=Alkalicella caledoniensis TaxID=2731377 RepID=A0A7G9W9Y8_ALKCA|nr:TMEM165/GDT1 family protein [Alkalicella caledoniensis]QNO15500.1 TMEM165/GDT1 family protein [Alkalicella caledoniensis]
MYEIIQAFLLILIAEMGDKTQILAMAFATKFSLGKVLLGVLIGSGLNHGLAAILGTYLTNIVPIETIRIIAAFAFIGFGLWSLKIDEDDEEGEEASSAKYGPVATVALAFFMGEMGDKTQLTVITLASQANLPLFTVFGSVAGMVVVSSIGVFVGSRLGRKIPEIPLKIAAAAIFILFGLMGLNESVPTQYKTIPLTIVFLSALGLVVTWMLNNIRKITSPQNTPYKRAAHDLYLNTQRVQLALKKVTDTNNHSLKNKELDYTIQTIINNLEKAQEKEEFIPKNRWDIPQYNGLRVSTKELKESLKETMETCRECPAHNENCVCNQTRRELEKIYLGKEVEYKGDVQEYYKKLKKQDPNFEDK